MTRRASSTTKAFTISLNAGDFNDFQTFGVYFKIRSNFSLVIMSIDLLAQIKPSTSSSVAPQSP